MKKRAFLGIVKVSITRRTAYILRFIIEIVLDPIALLIMYFVWKAVYNFNPEKTILGYSFNALISYYALQIIFKTLTDTKIDMEIAKSVRKGDLVVYMAKPVKLFDFFLAEVAGSKIFIIAANTIPIMIIAHVFFNVRPVGVLPTTISIFSLLLAFFIQYTYVSIFSLFSFWTKEYYGIYRARRTITDFTSGRLIPLEFFPGAVQKILNFLPFPYMLFYPVKIFLGQLGPQEMLKVLAKQAAWVVVLYTIYSLVWKKAQKHFMGVGV